MRGVEESNQAKGKRSCRYIFLYGNQSVETYSFLHLTDTLPRVLEYLSPVDKYVHEYLCYVFYNYDIDICGAIPTSI